MKREAEPFPVVFLGRMAQERIPALVIGRQALAVYGAPTATCDLDLLVLSPREETRLAHLAESFDLVKVAEETGGILGRRRVVRFADPPDLPSLAAPRILDVLTLPPRRGFSFEEAWRRRVPIRLEGGGTIHLPHVDDLITLKRLRNAPRDKEDIAWLRRNRRDLLASFPSHRDRA